MINDLARKQQLQKDIRQLKHLIFETQNQRVGQLLAGELAKVKAQLQLIVENSVKPLINQSKSVQPKEEQFISIHKFAWEDIQGTKKVKYINFFIISIMINLQGIKKQCQRQQIHPEFTSNSVTVKINQYKGKNHIFSIPKLYSQIVPQNCSFELTTNYLKIKLQKKYNTEWIDIHFKKDIFKPSKKQDKTHKQTGQQDQLMDMVKKIYQDGDPQMQKVIKEAFSNAQEKRKTNK